MRMLVLRHAVAAGAIAVTGCGAPAEDATPETEPVESVVPTRPESPLPDPDGWGVHVLALAVAPDGAVWVGTYGRGIFVSRDGTGTDWVRIPAGGPGSISWDFVNSFAFGPGEVWIGTIGNGWGLSRDSGASWRNWTFRDLGPQWQYVAPDGIRALGDTVYIATADGLRITSDDGDTYRDVTEENGLPSKYLLAIDVDAPEGDAPRLRATHLRGVSQSRTGGRSWETVLEAGGEGARRILSAGRDSSGLPAAACGLTELTQRICAAQAALRDYPDTLGEAIAPSERAHFWFQRPVGPEDNPHLDQTYTYGSTMGGNFQQHQGVEFNVPQGTPIRAIGKGVVSLADTAEAGSNTVVIRHERRLDSAYVWSAYYHNSELLVAAGDTVEAGDLIALAGNTGRATNDHLHLEIHTTPSDNLGVVADPEERFPPYTRNPQLWIEPLPETGVIAGRVIDATGASVPGARIYGVVKPEPAETPFSFAETYGDRAHPDPEFEEHFAIGDAPAGTYVLGVDIGEDRVWRKARVAAGKVTWVEFRP